MKVFISWSGEQSRAIADALRQWLPSVLQAVRPYFSPDDVAKGTRWSSEIAKELEASRIALLIVTSQNQGAPWLLFEAGALSKNLDKSKVCPLLFGGLEPTDVKGPLVQFQAAKFSKDEMRRVVKMINAELLDSALQADVFDKVFEMWWPKLNTDIEEALSITNSSKGELRRSDRDMLEEILELSRRGASERRLPSHLDHPIYSDILFGFYRLFRVTVAKQPPDPTIAKILADTMPALRVLMRQSRNKHLIALREEVQEYLHRYDSYQNSDPFVPIEPTEQASPDSE